MQTNKLIDNYKKFIEKSITYRRFKHKDLIEIILKFEKNPLFSIKTIGKSFEGREIKRVKLGNGKTKIMLWSQMHGNESVATLAILDIFNFFAYKNDFEDIKNLILKNCTLYFIPMLNPDGAELFKRRNAQDIDLNRDAIRLSAPESKILMSQIDDVKPEFAFNLHDQEIYYGVENTKNNTSIAFLSPASNFEKTINESRKKAMQVIATMNNMLQTIVPNGVAKYSDSFMPNAFGDNIQKTGASTILIESGYCSHDKERQLVRKYNFVSLIVAINSIANSNYKEQNIENYFNIPANIKNAFFDYLLQNVCVSRAEKEYLIDIGISRDKTNNEDFTDYEKEYLIWDIGDLSNYNAFVEIDFENKVFDDNENKIQKMNNADFLIQKMGKINK